MIFFFFQIACSQLSHPKKHLKLVEICHCIQGDECRILTDYLEISFLRPQLGLHLHGEQIQMYNQKPLPPPPSYFACSQSSGSITTLLYLIVPSMLQQFSNNRSNTSAVSIFGKYSCMLTNNCSLLKRLLAAHNIH